MTIYIFNNNLFYLEIHKVFTLINSKFYEFDKGIIPALKRLLDMTANDSKLKNFKMYKYFCNFLYEVCFEKSRILNTIKDNEVLVYIIEKNNLTDDLETLEKLYFSNNALSDEKIFKQVLDTFKPKFQYYNFNNLNKKLFESKTVRNYIVDIFKRTLQASSIPLLSIPKPTEYNILTESEYIDIVSYGFKKYQNSGVFETDKSRYFTPTIQQFIDFINKESKNIKSYHSSDSENTVISYKKLFEMRHNQTHFFTQEQINTLIDLHKE
jgi:hypothetical protein